ncbi:hypothetical protein H5410_004258 [Solanum commersonii]|uniref:Uncharacterized protein n=1 Tax=Solanum commersonii TaxID=4109 RepID=A0A9J6B6X1_SOLCO|nr:hypothetical protein H5410_004258 [Solanum commersonii]
MALSKLLLKIRKKQSKNMDKSQEADNEQSLENKELIIDNVTSKQNVENQQQHHDKSIEMSNENAIYKDIVSHSLVERIPQPQSHPKQSQQHSCSSSTEEVDSHSISQQVQHQNGSSNSKEGSFDENNKNGEEVFLKSNKSGKKEKNSSISIGSLPTRTSSRRGLQKNKD